MKKTRIKKHRFRFIRAYSTTFSILLSFGWIYLMAYFLGQNWRIRKLEKAYVKNARRLKKMILSLRGLYIKVGQLISIMSNFLPKEFRNELEGLQDRIPPRPYKEIAARIKHELGNSPDNIFESFDKKPIASASLAQVHKAVLKDRQEVAVKVQYMDIERMAKLDLKTLRRIFRTVEFFFGIKGISTNFLQIKEMILDELDFIKEADHIETIAANFSNKDEVKFPKVIRQYSTHRILVTEFMAGSKASNLSYLDKCELDRGVLAEKIVRAYCQMIFVDGIYHADPHPGNIFVQQDGSLVFLDFGAIAKLSPEMKEGIPQFLEGVLKRDKVQITEALQLMGFIAYEDNGYNTEKLIEYVYANFLQEMSFDSWSLNDIQNNIQNPIEVLGDFRKLNISFRDLMSKIQVPKDWILLERTVMLLMGLCTHLEPQMNPMKTIKPYLDEFVFGPERNWKKFVGNVIKKYLLSIIKLPEELNGLIAKANKGELNVRVKDVRESTDLLYALGHQILYGLFCMLTGGLAYFSYRSDEVYLVKWLGGASAFFAFSMVVNMWKVKRRKKRKR